MKAVLRAVAKGIEFARANPEEAFSIFVRFFPELNDELNRRSFGVTLPLYAKGVRHDDQARWETMQPFLWQPG